MILIKDKGEEDGGDVDMIMETTTMIPTMRTIAIIT